MTNYMQYIFHLALQSKHKIIVNTIIYFIFYLFINNIKIAFCMMEGEDLSEITATISQPSHQVRALKKEITDFAGTQLPLLEQIAEQQKTIASLKRALSEANRTISLHETNTNLFLEDINLLERENSRVFNEIRALPDIVEKKDVLQIMHNSDGRIFVEKLRTGRIVIRDSYQDY